MTTDTEAWTAKQREKGEAAVTKRQRHLAVERLVPEARPLTAPAQIDFLKTLRDEHDQALRQQIGGIRFSQLDPQSE